MSMTPWRLRVEHHRRRRQLQHINSISQPRLKHIRREFQISRDRRHQKPILLYRIQRRRLQARRQERQVIQFLRGIRRL